MFEPVETKVEYPKLEAEVGLFWREKDIFRRSVEERPDAPLFRFYEGPPTANGRPHVAHMLARALKDFFPRYKTMCGYRVPRKAGWDTHGLPVELEVEKDLGISGKPEIEKYGVERFNQRCKQSVWRYKADWEASTERLGYWLDLEHPYVTYENEYIESVWWALRQLWDRGLLYQGHKIVPYCPRCGTSLSSHEVAQGYAQAEDPSVYVRFPLQSLGGGQPAVPTSLLVWTTTPWTLPSNVAVAVDPDEAYVVAEIELPQGGRERLILGRGCLESVLGRAPYRVVEEFKGQRLLGEHYTPPFGFVPAAAPGSGEQAFLVLPGEFVSLDEGTGLVHQAPAFGEDDFGMGQRHHLPMFQPVDEAGRFTEAVPDWQGQFVKDADPSITENLRSRGLLFRSGRYEHTYPFCWRCDAPLIYYARQSWFIRTTAEQQKLIELNQQVNWVPSHLRDGRFGNFLESMVDWNLSRERYWGSPLPIWFCQDCGHGHCVGGFDELRRMARTPLQEPFDPHKPFIDQVELGCPACGGVMSRVPYVIDCWFESGSMPFAQYHYPFENRELFETMFPADYICEAIDQTRGWFYALHAIAGLIFGQLAYRNCLCTEFGVDTAGLKMSKHKGNVISPDEFFDREGADALRWFLFSGSPPWMVKRFDHASLTDVQNQVLDTMWNVYAFFVLYANIDGFEPRAPGARAPAPGSRGVLDRWLLSRLQTVTGDVRARLDSYDVTGAARALSEFLDDLSNWYVRRGRRRYWKAGDDQDKAGAHWTLYQALLHLTRLMAPFLPYVTEAMHRNLAGPGDRESVHLEDYPLVDETLRDQALERAMALCRRLVSLGRAARNRAQIRTRQPLPEIVLSGARLGPDTEALLAEELNVKQVRYDEAASSYVTHTVKPNYEAVGPRFGALTPAIARALAEGDAAEIARALESGRSVRLALPGQEVQLGPEDVAVRSQEREGYAVEREGGLQVALSTAVSKDLLLEGLAREVVNRVQRLRKESGFDVADHIEASFEAGGVLYEALERHGQHIAREVLADRMRVLEPGTVNGATGGAAAGAERHDLDVEGEPLVVALKRLDPKA